MNIMWNGLKMLLVDKKIPLIVIVGPTAVGKTELSIKLARQMNGEIVSADSRQIYRKMNIGTAKPTPEELSAVQHHLIDVVNPEEIFSLALFQQSAYQIIDDVHRRGKLPFLVGGTGQYVRAVVQGWKPPELEPDIELRKKLEEDAKTCGGDYLYKQLCEKDPDAASMIDPRNVRRVIRALEVIEQTNQPFSVQRGKVEPRYACIQVGLIRPRQELYQRIDLRIDQMIASGLLQEVEKLLADGCPIDSPSLSAIGYREMVAVIQGKYDIEEAVVLMKRATRNYVRRQANWFQLNDPTIQWFEMNEQTFEQVLAYCQDQLRDH
jgi:tRNA dimethylallyltransferase